MKPVVTPHQDSGTAITPDVSLGDHLRLLRTARGWTLAEASAASGVARSSLSKIENGQMSPTYDLLIKLSRGYGIDLAELFSARPPRAASGRMTVTRAGKGQRHQAALYRHHVLAADLARKKMMPFLTRIEPGRPLAREDWSAHAGEEFLYVLAGNITFYTEHYEPVTLGPGDSLYIDSSMQHACVANGDTAAEVLWISAE